MSLYSIYGTPFGLSDFGGPLSPLVLVLWEAHWASLSCSALAPVHFNSNAPSRGCWHLHHLVIVYTIIRNKGTCHIWPCGLIVFACDWGRFTGVIPQLMQR